MPSTATTITLVRTNRRMRFKLISPWVQAMRSPWRTDEVRQRGFKHAAGGRIVVLVLGSRRAGPRIDHRSKSSHLRNTPLRSLGIKPARQRGAGLAQRRQESVAELDEAH